MRMVFKSKYKECKKQKSRILLITFFLIFLFTFFWLYEFNKHVKNNLIEISTIEVNRAMYRVITDEISHDILNKDSLEDILVINKNESGEILYVDFNLDKAYQVLDSVSNILTDYISSLEGGEVEIAYTDSNITHDSNCLTLNIPVGSALSSNYLYNLGPKIPVKINFVGTVLTNLETRVTDYGLNNALVEVFVYIEFHNQILSPFKMEELELKYDAVIASMMIKGEVPSFYNGVIEKETETYTKTIN